MLSTRKRSKILVILADNLEHVSKVEVLLGYFQAMTSILHGLLRPGWNIYCPFEQAMLLHRDCTIRLKLDFMTLVSARDHTTEARVKATYLIVTPMTG